MAIYESSNKYLGHYYLSVVASATIPWGVKLNSVAILLLTSYSLLLISTHKIKLKDSISPNNASLVGLFALPVIGSLYSIDIVAAFSVLEKQFSFIALPLAFSVSEHYLCRDKMHRIIRAFVISCLIACLYMLGGNLLAYLNYTDQEFWRYRDFTRIANIHPVYFSTYLVFCALYIKTHLLRHWLNLSPTVRTIYSVALVFFVFHLLMIQARTPIVAWLLLSGIILFRHGYSNLGIKKLVLASLTILLLCFFVGRAFQNDIWQLLDRFVSVPDALDNRLLQWKGAYFAIKDNLIFGTGTGDSQLWLDRGYLRAGADFAIDQDYNTHNQYLDYFLKYGILGTLLPIVLICSCFQSAQKGRKNELLLYLLLLIMICLTTENLLNRQKGIVFFSFFYSLLSSKYASK